MALDSLKWGYIRIITGTILGGMLGFYVMHRVEVAYKVSIFHSVFCLVTEKLARKLETFIILTF